MEEVLRKLIIHIAEIFDDKANSEGFTVCDLYAINALAELVKAYSMCVEKKISSEAINSWSELITEKINEGLSKKL